MDAPCIATWNLPMPVTALYAALLVPLYIFLSFRVINVRVAQRLSVGDGGDQAMLRRMRVHANFAEYAPLALVVIGLAESLNTPALVLHLLGVLLLAGRLAHAYGMSAMPEKLQLRVAGMMLTFSALGLGALACLWGAFQRGFGL